MSSRLIALGISHKTAPLALRERLALPEGRAAGVLRDLVAHAEIHEAVALTTMSAASSSRGRSSNRTAWPPKRCASPIARS